MCQGALQIVHDGEHHSEQCGPRPLHRLFTLAGGLLLVVFEIGGDVEELLPVALRFLFVARRELLQFLH
jgi:hypothetical protein